MFWNWICIKCHRVWNPVIPGHGAQQHIRKKAVALSKVGAEVTDKWTAERCFLGKRGWIYRRVAEEQEAWWNTFDLEIPDLLIYNILHGLIRIFVQLKWFHTTFVIYKEKGLRFGRRMVPSITESGNKANPMDTVPTLCSSHKQRSMSENTAASGKTGKNMYVFYILSWARLHRRMWVLWNGFQHYFLQSPQGYGMYFYSSCEVYEGDWIENLRSGWGRMYYECGDIYEGEWLNDKKEGQGIIRYSKKTLLFLIKKKTKLKKKTDLVRLCYLKTWLMSLSKWKLVWRHLAGWRKERKWKVLLRGQRTDLWRHLAGRSGEMWSSVWFRQGWGANTDKVSNSTGKIFHLLLFFTCSQMWNVTTPVS